MQLASTSPVSYKRDGIEIWSLDSVIPSSFLTYQEMVQVFFKLRDFTFLLRSKQGLIGHRCRATSLHRCAVPVQGPNLSQSARKISSDGLQLPISRRGFTGFGPNAVSSNLA